MDHIGAKYDLGTLNRFSNLSIDWRAPSLLMHLGVLVVFAVVMILAPIEKVSGDSMTRTLAASQLCLFAWMLFSWRISSGTLLNPYGLFILAAGAFHCALSFLILIGRTDAMFLVSELGMLSLCRTIIAVTIGLGMLHLGALGGLLYADSRETAEREPDRSMLSSVGLALTILSLPGIISTLAYRLEVVGVGGYIELFQSGGLEGPMQTLLGLSENLFLAGVMMLIAGSNNRGKTLGLVVITVRSVVLLYLGYRAYALLPIVAAVWLWHTVQRKLPVKSLTAAGAAFLILVAPIVRGLREGAGLDRWSIGNIVEVWRGVDNPLVSLLSDMGSSVLTVAYTIELVPSARPFEMGLGYVRAALNSLPIIDIGNSYGYASSWLAWAVRPDWASRGFGFGYSFIAEAFLNFGWLGIAFVTATIGFAIVRMGLWVKQDPLRAVLVAVFLPSLLFFTRGESIDLVRPLLWQAVLPCAFVLFLRKLGWRSRMEALQIDE